MQFRTSVKISGLLISFIFVSAFTYHTVFIKSKQLDQEYQEIYDNYKKHREILLSLSTEIYMLEKEIYALENDSEESSLAARTLLGMVHATELVYQLNHRPKPNQ